MLAFKKLIIYEWEALLTVTSNKHRWSQIPLLLMETLAECTCTLSSRSAVSVSGSATIPDAVEVITSGEGVPDLSSSLSSTFKWEGIMDTSMSDGNVESTTGGGDECVTMVTGT